VQFRSISAVFEEIIKIVEPLKRLADEASDARNARDCGDHFHYPRFIAKKRIF
jgi:hypothetical protein